MHWENLTTADPIELAGLCLLLLVMIWAFWLAIRTARAEHRARQAANHAYFREGGLIRTLIARWHRGTPRLTDQRHEDR